MRSRWLPGEALNTALLWSTLSITVPKDPRRGSPAILSQASLTSQSAETEERSDETEERSDERQGALTECDEAANHRRAQTT